MKNKTTILLSSVIGFLLLVIVFIYLYLTYFVTTVKVPDFFNLTVDEVTQYFTDNDVLPSQYEIIYDYSETVEKNHVISQSIKPENTLKEDEVITVKVSNGKDPNLVVTIPDFKGQTQETIQQWFNDNLFTDVTFEYIASADIAKGQYVGLNVSDNNQKRSALIVVKISAGTDTIGLEIEMPDFKDFTKANIQAWAKTNHITLTFKTRSSTTVDKDKVIGQNPTAGSKIKTGGKAIITLSSGKDVAITSFVNKTKKEAATWISNNSLKANYMQVYSSTVTSGNIVSQNPSTGTITQGSTVTFEISVGSVPLNSYIDKPQSEFISYLNSLNNGYNKSAKITYESSEQASDKTSGTIIQMTVNGESITQTKMVAPGSKVQLVVAKAQIKQVTVENKSNTTLDKFQRYLEQLGLKLGHKTEKYHDSIPSNTIISNDTGTYTSGTSVNYIVSLGAYQINTNNLKNTSYASLVNSINSANNIGAGITLSKTEASDTSIAAGNIISCSLSGKKLSCVISIGKKPTVKNYVNQPRPCNDSCVIENVIYKIDKNFVESDTVAANNVISQSIAGGTEVDSNTVVTLIISKGPRKAIVENFVGQLCGANCTTDKGYNLAFVYADDSSSKGTIIAQSIPANTAISLGETVTLTVSNGPKMCAVPNSIVLAYSGSYDETISKINSQYSGFTIEIIDVIDNDGKNGSVVSITYNGQEVSQSELPCGSKLTFKVTKPNQ